MSWALLIKQFENYLKIERSLSLNSVEAYSQDIHKLKQYFEITGTNVQPTSVTGKQISDFLVYLNELGLAPHSQARIISGLKAFFHFLIAEDMIKGDVLELIESPKLGRKLPDVLSFNEIEALITAIDLSEAEGHRNRAMLELLYSSGLRVSELVSLKLNNLHFDAGFIRVIGKGNKERLIPVGREAIKYIELYLENSRIQIPVQKGHENFVFLNRRGKSLSRVMIFLIIKGLATKIGLNKQISPILSGIHSQPI